MRIRNAIPPIAGAFFLVTVILMGCAKPEENGAKVISEAYTAAANTLQAYMPPTPKPSPTQSPLPPTASPPPTATFPAAKNQATNLPVITQQIDPVKLPYYAEHITISSHTTSTSLSAVIQPGKVKYYVLSAQADQPISIKVDSQNQSVSLAVVTENGKILLEPSQRLIAWKAIIPASQDYYVLLFGGNTREKYTLSIEIPVRLTLSSRGEASVDSWTRNLKSNAYVVRVKQGQTLDVALYAFGNATFSIYGFSDGYAYLSADPNKSLFSLEALFTQEYIIRVVSTKGKDTGYSLVVDVR